MAREKGRPAKAMGRCSPGAAVGVETLPNGREVGGLNRQGLTVLVLDGLQRAGRRFSPFNLLRSLPRR